MWGPGIFAQYRTRFQEMETSSLERAAQKARGADALVVYKPRFWLETMGEIVGEATYYRRDTLVELAKLPVRENQLILERLFFGEDETMFTTGRYKCGGYVVRFNSDRRYMLTIAQNKKRRPLMDLTREELNLDAGRFQLFSADRQPHKFVATPAPGNLPTVQEVCLRHGSKWSFRFPSYNGVEYSFSTAVAATEARLRFS